MRRIAGASVWCGLLIVGACSVLIAGCEAIPPVYLSGNQLVAFDNASVGYSVGYPEGLTAAVEDGEEIWFRQDGHAFLRVVYSTQEEARNRGLWATAEPTAQVVVDGRRWHLHEYDHQDILKFVRTRSYVIAHRGRFLALEFRSMPLDVEAAVVDSVRFLP